MNDPSPYAPNLQDYAARVQREGMAVLLITVTGWNGTANDPSVRVDLSQSVYGAPGNGGTTAPNPNLGSWVPGTSTTTPPVLPVWNGDDWFWARRDSYINNDQGTPVIYDDTAYVTNNQLVAHLPPGARLTFVGPTLGIEIALTQGTAVATFSEDRQTAEVIIGGRWSKTDLLLTAKSVNVCPGSATYTLINSALDNIADVRANPTEDGMDLPCNAVSFGVRLNAFRGHIAGLVNGPPLPMPCP